MKETHSSILAINAGSSSIKFALFEPEHGLAKTTSGRIERIDSSQAVFAVTNGSLGKSKPQSLEAPGGGSAVEGLVEWLARNLNGSRLVGIAHRLVHGGPKYIDHQQVSLDLVQELENAAAFDPEHIPLEARLLRECQLKMPGVPQYACFDTAFHKALPPLGRLLPIPRKYQASGVRRYGFHGLSYSYLLEELARIAGPEAAHGKIIMAHLGNGASLAAVDGGESIDTSMSFTPTSGVPMSTRCGDIDPGLLFHLMKAHGLSLDECRDMTHSKSGLLGISETSSDMRDLLNLESSDARAAEAVAFFCYSIRKWIGSFAAALGGLDTVIFSGGIGENAPPIRARICKELRFLGIEIDPVRNDAGAPVISLEGRRAVVRVIKTDEERMMARTVCRLQGISVNEFSNDKQPL